MAVGVRWLVFGFVAMLCGAAGIRGASPVVLNDDGAWNWLQDERAVVVGDRVIVASVAMGHRDAARTGDVDVVSYDRRNGVIARSVLHHEATEARRRLWQDDHSSPALLVRPDGRIVAMYAIHAQGADFRFRISREPGDASAWGDEQTFTTSPGSRVAFPCLVHLASENEGRGRLLEFFRGLGNRGLPSVAHSDDGGHSWTADGVFLQSPAKVTPYVKYAGDGCATVHFAFTDGHRVDFNNGVFHASYRDGQLWRSDGGRIAALAEGLTAPRQATEVYRANPDSVAMISDLALDGDGHPCVVYSVQMNTRRLRPRPVGADHRYRYARWDGHAWRDFEIAFAGTETHDAPDDDCTGLAAIDPRDVSVVYVSTNADPVTGQPLISRTDRNRHWEIFQGTTRDGGVTWNWRAVTRDSTADNLRPIVPVAAAGPSPLLWLRGAMRMPKDSALEVVMLAPPRP